MSRSDEHRIAVLNPADYRIAAFEDCHEEEGFFEWLTPTFAHSGVVNKFGGNFNRDSVAEEEVFAELDERLNEPEVGYGCRICGQSHGNRYWTYFEHIPTGDIIRVGSKCAIMVGLGTREELEDRRAHERREMAIERGKHLNGNPARRQALGVATDAVMDWQETHGIEPFNATGSKLMTYAEGVDTPWIIQFAADVLNRFNREAYLSDKQWKILCEFNERYAKDRERIENQETREQQWQREDEEAEEIPTEGRVHVKGEVIKVDEEEDTYSYDGFRTVMTVKDERGFRIKGSVPSAIWNVQKGDQVEFDARLKRSRPNPKYGFYSRPTKALIVK